MPVFRSGDTVPPWCELTFFEIVEISAGARHHFPRREAKEKLIVGRGGCLVNVAGEEQSGEKGSQFDLLRPDASFEVTAGADPVTAIRMCGRWGDETGGSGLFSVEERAQPADRGDPVSYPKTTCLDSHFHDCDEYWIIWEGAGLAVSEGLAYEVKVGDCVATGMGHHHDVPGRGSRCGGLFRDDAGRGEAARPSLGAHPRSDGATPGACLRP